MTYSRPPQYYSTPQLYSRPSLGAPNSSLSNTNHYTTPTNTNHYTTPTNGSSILGSGYGSGISPASLSSAYANPSFANLQLLRSNSAGGLTGGFSGGLRLDQTGTYSARLTSPSLSNNNSKHPNSLTTTNTNTSSHHAVNLGNNKLSINLSQLTARANEQAAGKSKNKQGLMSSMKGERE